MDHSSNNDIFNDFRDNFVPPVDATSETISFVSYNLYIICAI